MAQIRDTNSTIVALGRFNPLIFQPEWLRRHNVIGEIEAEAAVNGGIEVIHSDLSIINLNAKKLVVDQNRFMITVLEEPFVVAKDFAANCFNLLPHTPVRAVGINWARTLRAKNAKAWHAFGDLIAPKNYWDSLLFGDEGEHTGGLRTITMERSVRPDKYRGHTRVMVEALQTGHSDTQVSINDHYEIEGASGAGGTAGDACELINDQWEFSIERSEKICRSLGEVLSGCE